MTKRPYRVVSFPGAGFDTVMQMGVVHAFLVTRRKSPDMVAGISLGAITATALGDVLQAGAGAKASESEDEEVRVARFSELLEAFRNAPSTVLKGFFPDPLETNSAHALKPVELPRHFQEERTSRRGAVASRTGLIRLFDHLLRVRVSVKLVAQLARVGMGWREAGEMSWVRCIVERGRLLVRMWWLVARNILALSMPISLVAKVQLCELVGISGKSEADGVEAGYIIFNRGAWFRWVQEKSVWLLLGFLPLALLLAAVPGLLFWGLTSLPVFRDSYDSTISGWAVLRAVFLAVFWLAAWGCLFCRKTCSAIS